MNSEYRRPVLFTKNCHLPDGKWRGPLWGTSESAGHFENGLAIAIVKFDVVNVINVADSCYEPENIGRLVKLNTMLLKGMEVYKLFQVKLFRLVLDRRLERGRLPSQQAAYDMYESW